MKHPAKHRPVTDSELELMARVLAHVEPLPEDPELKRRVRSRLRAKAAAGANSGRHTLALAVLLLAGVAAAHGSPHELAQAVTARAKAWWSDTPKANQRPRVHSAPPIAVTVPVTTATSEPARSDDVASRSAQRSSVPAAKSVAAKSVAPKNAAVPISVTQPNDPAKPSPASAGTQLIIDALRARQAGDWVTAGALANAYRQSFPTGPLEEEALMLALDAARARGASTRGLAGQYLRRFPNGRYRKWATGLLAKPQ